MELKQAWDECIRMWEWIVEQDGSVNELKHAYSCKYGGPMCNFCSYDRDHDVGSCVQCPGVLVDSTFSCFDADYHYADEPVKFLAKLKELYPYD